MQVTVIKNFITQEEAIALNTFVFNSIAENKFSYSKIAPDGGKNLLSRFNRKLKFPETAMQIKSRIQKLLELEDKDTYTLWNKSGIAVSHSLNGPEIVPHKDVRQHNKSLLRCNVLSSASEKGGVLTVDGKEFELEALSMYLCLVSEYTHSVSKTEGKTPRILWQFGFKIDQKDWENKKIKVQE